MKNLIAIALLLAISAAVIAQDSVKKDTAWKIGGMFSLTVSQAGFTNWSAGGENSYAGNGRLGLTANYAKNKSSWENGFDMAYGRSKQGSQNVRKTDDFIELNSKYGYKASKKWYYSAVFNGKTQLENGYEYSDIDSVADVRISGPMNPLRINLAIGMDYKPDAYLSLFLSPLSLKYTYVSDTTLGAKFSLDPNTTSRTDFGALIKFKYERGFYQDKLNFLTKLDLFGDYQELNAPDDIDVNWEVILTFNVFKVLSFNINTHLIWDKDINFTEKNADGSTSDVSKIQFKEVIGAGIAYKF